MVKLARLNTTIFCPEKFLQSYLDKGYTVVEIFTATCARFSDGKPVLWYTLREMKA